MRKTLIIIGALDTKGEDFAFVKEEVKRRGHIPLVVDTSIVGDPYFKPDISSAQVAEAGDVNIDQLRKKSDKGFAMEVMTKGVAEVVRKLYTEGRADGVFSMGGSAGTSIGTSAMRVLPVGIPKLMVSTVASGDVKPYVGIKDVVMFPSIVDVSGINSISAKIYANAVGAMIGMLETVAPKVKEKPLIAASMFGNTTTIVGRCKKIMKEHGYEVLVFHATGTGGQTLESLVEDGYIQGALEITPTEWADELVGGVLSAGPARLDATPKKGLHQVFVPGCLDMVNFWAPETVPEKFKGRTFYQWNPNVTLMRTTPEENRELGRIIAEKLNKSEGKTAVFLPLKGVSMIDAPGKEFWWPEADKALFDSIKKNLKPQIPVYELDNNINDEDFSDAVANKLLEFLSH